LKWQIKEDLNLVFTVVYKEILQLAFVEPFLEMLSKAFINGVYNKALQAENALTRDEVFLRLIADPDMFGPHYRIVYEKWDSLVKKD